MKLKILEILIIIGIILSLIFVCNPLYIRRLNAETADADALEKLYSPVTPFIELQNIRLTYTGYYTVDSSGRIQSRYYLGQLGDGQCFVELSEAYAQRMTADLPASLAGDGTLGKEDAPEIIVTLTVRLIPADRILRAAAGELDMSLEEYAQNFNINIIAASEYRENSLIIDIYYALAALLALIILAKILYERKTGGL